MEKNNFNKSLFYDKQLLKLLEYSWPGNVRELRNVVERIICIPEYDMGELTKTQKDSAENEKRQKTKTASFEWEQGEKQQIIACLRQCKSNISEAARTLGISRKTLYKKLDKYQLR